MDVEVKKPTQEELDKMNVRSWPIWEKEESSFDWFYDQSETCYFLEGDVEVQLPDGRRIEVQKGDLVSFPKGLKCRWQIKKKVRKHYNFE
ncbi:MAG: cupin domain-containing protein [Candidatus Omnitrophota bacterium]|nr:MAG: cupin domain-containing protein [Candidatus Omnitrophota bacterium]